MGDLQRTLKMQADGFEPQLDGIYSDMKLRDTKNNR